MSQRIYRYEVPVDDRWHIFTCEPPLWVGCRNHGFVEFWAYPAQETGDSGITDAQHLRVYGTGHEMPDELRHVGSTMTPDGALVWHLMADPWKVAQ
jgi:hypothetical protein